MQNSHFSRVFFQSQFFAYHKHLSKKSNLHALIFDPYDWTYLPVWRIFSSTQALKFCFRILLKHSRLVSSKNAGQKVWLGLTGLNESLTSLTLCSFCLSVRLWGTHFAHIVSLKSIPVTNHFPVNMQLIINFKVTSKASGPQFINFCSCFQIQNSWQHTFISVLHNAKHKYMLEYNLHKTFSPCRWFL